MLRDTLSADTMVVNQWLSDGDYDYQHDLANNGESLWQTIMKKIGEWLQELFSDVVNTDGVSTILTIIAIAVLATILFFVWRKVSRLRMSPKTKDLDYDVTEDTIYGIDFDAELARALSCGDHRGALRMVYLRTLRLLHDEKVLEWNNTKTPQEFVSAIADPGLRSEFAALTSLYVRVRYGHFPALLSDVESAIALERTIRKHLKKGGEA